MSDGEIQYVRADDGTHLAYRVRGDGPVDLIEIGSFGTLFPIDAADEQPRWRRFEERLGRFCRLIRFDLRGIGYSDPLTNPPTIDDWVTDTLSVLDAVGSEQAAVLGCSFGGFPAIQLASTDPERVSALILANTGARFGWAEDYRIGAKADVAAQFAAITDTDTASEDGDDDDTNDIDYMAPSIAADPEARRWWTRTARRGAGPAVANAMWQISMEADVREHVERITAPTLILRTIRNRFVAPALGGWLAEHVPDSKLCDLPGRDHIIWAVPDDLVSNQIEEFLTGRRSALTGTRRIHAILFTDIVDSTAHNATAGDAAWLELLARHDDLADGFIQQRGGRLIKRLGDGLLAVFPLASDALDTGLAITNAADDLGIGVRAAVHVAEVEEVEGDVLGLGVTVAARVLGEADGGEVLTTRAVVELLAGSAYEFTARGAHELKGVAGRWELSAVNARSANASPTSTAVSG